MTQHELIISYVKEFGKILPAKLYGVKYKDGMFGSELSKRCRELRAKGILSGFREGKFEVFVLAEKGEAMYQITDTASPVKQVKPVLVEQKKMFADQPIKFNNYYDL